MTMQKENGAAENWMSVNKAHKGTNYLIAANYSGINAMDVTMYNGRRSDGSHWWTLANVEIDAACIIHIAELNDPFEEPDRWKAR